MNVLMDVLMGGLVGTSLAAVVMYGFHKYETVNFQRITELTQDSVSDAPTAKSQLLATTTSSSRAEPVSV